MSFNISLSGLNAAQKALDVTSNNIANVATTGFKYSRAEFADVYTTSVMANSKTTVGSGVQTASVSQQFSQGSIESTNNTLDMAISGEGFFVLNSEGSGSNNEHIYTRAGNFQIDAEGNVVTTSGYYLQVYEVDEESGTVTSPSLDATKNLVIPTSAGDPKKTETVVATMTLNSSSTSITKEPKFDEATGTWNDTVGLHTFDPTNKNTFTNSTSAVIYDSQGNSYTATYYYVKTEGVNEYTDKDGNKATGTIWEMYIGVDDSKGNTKIVNLTATNSDNRPINSQYIDADGNPQNVQAALVSFNESGKPINANGDEILISFTTEELGTVEEKTETGSIIKGAGVLQDGVNQKQKITFDVSLKQVNSEFAVTKLTQDGSTVGQLTGLEIGGNGLIQATYSNGTTSKIGMVALAKFSNSQGLSKIGDTCWKQSITSGEAVASQPGVGTTGTIKSSALESSNVDLSASLVDLITAQRNYQANSKSLEASSAIMQTILNVS